MKALAVVLTLVMMISVLFAGCGRNKNDDDISSGVSSVSNPSLTDDIMSDASGVVSRIESGIDSVVGSDNQSVNNSTSSK